MGSARASSVVGFGSAHGGYAASTSISARKARSASVSSARLTNARSAEFESVTGGIMLQTSRADRQRDVDRPPDVAWANLRGPASRRSHDGTAERAPMEASV